jgi:DNA-binding CsgD family transcriptional regulator
MAAQGIVAAKGVEARALLQAAETDGSLRHWIQQIISSNNDITLHEIDGEVQEFLYDAELEGVRVVMIRRRQPTALPRLVLSPREREIARMVAKGYPNKTIAAVLDISSWTVCTYLRRIFAKLNVCSRAAMVARLVEDGALADRTDGGPPSPSCRK